MHARFLLRALPVVVGAIGAGLLTASKTGLLTLSDQQTLACIAAVGAAAIVGPFLPDLAEATRLRRQRDVSISLRRALVYVIDDCHVSWKDVGAHFFVVRRWPRISVVRSWPFLLVQRRLVDIGHERLDVVAYPSAIEFTKGKGVVGTCWKQRKESYLDLTEHFSPHLPLTKETWANLDQPVTLGLTWDDYQATKDIPVVAAYVARNKAGKVVGVVSVEAPAASLEAPPKLTLDCFRKATTRSYIGNMGDTIATDIGR